MKLKHRINRLVGITAIALLSSIVSSCMTDDVGNASVTGAAIGGTGGGLLAKEHGYRTSDGIMVGGLVGAALGQAVGETAADRRKNYTDQQDALDDDIGRYRDKVNRNR